MEGIFTNAPAMIIGKESKNEKIIKKSQNPEHSKGQTRYNGHLDQQFKKVKDYLEQYQENPLNLPSLTAIRNKILTDVFKILREEKPSTK
jgi:hypothetical protein